MASASNGTQTSNRPVSQQGISLRCFLGQSGTHIGNRALDASDLHDWGVWLGKYPTHGKVQGCDSFWKLKEDYCEHLARGMNMKGLKTYLKETPAQNDVEREHQMKIVVCAACKLAGWPTGPPIELKKAKFNWPGMVERWVGDTPFFFLPFATI